MMALSNGEGDMAKRAAIYVRVSTDKQTLENQIRALRQIAERRGWEVVEEYRDAGISGAKGRDNRGKGILKVAREIGVGTGTVQRIARELGPFDAAAA